MDHSEIPGKKGNGAPAQSGLSNIQEERSDELRQLQSFRGGIEEDDAQQQQQPEKPRSFIRLQSAPPQLPRSPESSSVKVGVSGTMPGSSYSVPFSDGVASKPRFQNTRELRHSMNDRYDAYDKNEDGTDPAILKRASSGSSNMASILLSPGRRPRPVNRYTQFQTTLPILSPKIPKPATGVGRSSSLGNSSVHSSVASGVASAASGASNGQSGGNVISALGLGSGGAGAFTSNLSRKSQNFRRSIARHSGALARFTRQGSNIDADAAEATISAQKRANAYRYNLGDPVLICNHNSRWANCVNRHGYPPGGGTTSDEQRGPYIHVLGTVKTVHYEENAVFYTVTRADTGVDVRGDPGRYRMKLGEFVS